MKTYIIASLLAASLMFAGTVTLVGAASAADNEQPRTERQERGPWGRLSDEQRAKLRPLLKAHWEATESARDDLWVKERTLRALERNPNASSKELTALVKEVADLRGQLRKEHRAFSEKVSREMGMEFPMGMGGMCSGPGFGSRHGGYGMHGHKGFGHGDYDNDEGRGGYHGRGRR